MTFEAPRHAVRLRVINHRHVIDLSVAARATDPAIDVGRVVVINVIRGAMELDPFDRLPGFPARPDRLQLRIVLLDLGMTGHAGLGVRQIRMRRHIHEAVAITAIHPQLRNVNVVRKRDRLDRLISDPRIFRGNIVPRPRGQPANDDDAANENLKRQPIRPSWKKIRHRAQRTVLPWRCSRQEKNEPDCWLGCAALRGR